MTVIIPRYSGFCAGVKIAEKEIFKQIASGSKQPVYILGDLIHNQNYINFLKSKNILTVNDMAKIPKNSKVIIRTHGIDRKVEEDLHSKFEVIDLTCYKVKDLQKKILDYAQRGFFIFISGKKKHPEVIGLTSYTRDSYVISSKEELNQVLQDPFQFISPHCQKILITSQTTASRTLFEELCNSIPQKLRNHSIEISDSICSITSKREEHALKLQETADITFVVGDPKSSNANKLYRILREKQKTTTFFIADLNTLLNLNLHLKDYGTALVVSSSSTPSFVEQEICNYLEHVSST